MDERQIALVQTSFRKLGLVSEVLAADFYDSLFRTSPGLASLFHSSKSTQYKKLLSGLTKLIHDLDQAHAFSTFARELGVRHAEYGVHANAYAIAKPALLAVIKKGLGPDFHEETERAWEKACDKIFKEMQASVST